MKTFKFIQAFVLVLILNFSTKNYSFGQTWNIPIGIGSPSQTFLGTTSNSSFLFRTNNSDRMIITNNGDVGINNNSPYPGLHVKRHASYGTNVWIDATNTTGGKNWVIQSTGGDNMTGQGNLIFVKEGGIGPAIVISPDNNIGIGINNPYPGLHVKRHASYGTNVWIDATNTTGGKNWVIQSTGGDNMTGHGNLLFLREGGNLTVAMSPNGQVGIGHADFTKATGYMFSVAGKIICEEVRVKLYGNWPDFVFTKEYKLRSLEEVETFINENNHLPDVPSAEEVKENGIETGEMLRIQMQKIEELTLYLIQLKKENEELRKLIETEE